MYMAYLSFTYSNYIGMNAKYRLFVNHVSEKWNLTELIENLPEFTEFYPYAPEHKWRLGARGRILITTMVKIAKVKIDQ